MKDATSVDKYLMTWSEFGKFTDQLVEKLEQYDKVKDLTRVVGISRGGLPLGVAMSHRLGLPFTPVTAKSYSGKRQGEIVCETPTEALKKCSGHILLVDDLADSGRTFDFLMTKIRNLTGADFTTATLYYKETSIIKPDFFIEQTDQWIVFPWESPND